MRTHHRLPLLLALAATIGLLTACPRSYYGSTGGGYITIGEPTVHNRESVMPDIQQEMEWMRAQFDVGPTGHEVEGAQQREATTGVKFAADASAAEISQIPSVGDDANTAQLQQAQAAPASQAKTTVSHIDAYKKRRAYRDTILADMRDRMLDDTHDRPGGVLRELTFNVSIIPPAKEARYLVIMATVDELTTADLGTSQALLTDNAIKRHVLSEWAYYMNEIKRIKDLEIKQLQDIDLYAAYSKYFVQENAAAINTAVNAWVDVEKKTYTLRKELDNLQNRLAKLAGTQKSVQAAMGSLRSQLDTIQSLSQNSTSEDLENAWNKLAIEAKSLAVLLSSPASEGNNPAAVNKDQINTLNQYLEALLEALTYYSRQLRQKSKPTEPLINNSSPKLQRMVVLDYLKDKYTNTGLITGLLCDNPKNPQYIAVVPNPNAFSQMVSAKKEAVRIVSVSPKVRAQNVSVMEATKFYAEIAASIKAGTVADLGLGLSYGLNELAETIQPNPLALGFKSGGKAFGWILGPRLQLIDGDLELFQSAVVHPLSVTLVTPALASEITLTLMARWIDKNGQIIENERYSTIVNLQGKETAESNDGKKGNKPNDEKKTAELTVKLAHDVERAIQGYVENQWGKLERPRIVMLEDKYRLLSGVSGQRLVIQGENLWRNPSVYVGNHRADRVLLLPHMEGIEAVFDDPIPYPKGGVLPLTVATSRGNRHLFNAVAFEKGEKTLEKFLSLDTHLLTWDWGSNSSATLNLSSDPNSTFLMPKLTVEVYPNGAYSDSKATIDTSEAWVGNKLKIPLKNELALGDDPVALAGVSAKGYVNGNDTTGVSVISGSNMFVVAKNDDVLKYQTTATFKNLSGTAPTDSFIMKPQKEFAPYVFEAFPKLKTCKIGEIQASFIEGNETHTLSVLKMGEDASFTLQIPGNILKEIKPEDGKDTKITLTLGFPGGELECKPITLNWKK